MTEKPTYEELGKKIQRLELHQKAEKMLQERLIDNRDSSEMTPEQSHNLLHELRVHQIELEVQNDEFRRINEKLDASTELYFNFYNLSPVGYCSISLKGLILEANLTISTMLGVTRNVFLKQPITHFIHKEDQDIFYLHCKKLFERDKPQSDDLRMLDNKGTPFWVNWATTSEKDSGGTSMYNIVISNITERKQAEEALQESEEKYRRMAENSPDMIYRMSLPGGEYQYVNSAVTSIFGYPPQAWYDNPLLVRETLHPDYLSYFEKQWKNLLKGDLPQSYEYKIIHKDGCVRWINQRNVLVKDKDNRPLAIEGILTDISLCKQAEEAQRETLQSLEFALYGGNLGMWDWNPQDGAVVYNDLWAQMLEYRPDEVEPTVEFFRQHVHPEDLAVVIDRLTGHAEGRLPVYESEHRLRTKSGRWLWVLDRGKIVERDKDGRPVRIIGLIADITQRKRAEDALEKSEQKYRFFADNIDDIIWTMNAELTHYTYMSLSISRLGYTPEEFISKPFDAFIVPKYREHLQRTITERLQKEQQGKGDDEIRRFEIEYLKKSGKAVYMESITRPLRDENGLFKGLLGVNRDITEKIQHKKALQKAHDELEQRVQERTIELQKTQKALLHAEKLSAIGGLSASIAHEFNNPLQGVMSVIKGIKRRATMDEEDAQLVDSAIIECDRMKNLISSLQDFNRPSSGRMASIDIHAAIDSLLMLSKKEYQTKGITVETSYADLPQIKAVADQIKQVLLNLLNNAAYACSRGDTITISTDVVSKERIRIKIRDTGKGIKPEHLDKIFDPFFTTKPATKGTGLGLSVSYGIIKKHGGRIDVESEPNKGTIFTITLPIAGVNNEK